MSSSSRDGENLTIPALGRTASLGYLYDQRRDEFKTSIFRRKLLDDDEAITTLDAHDTDLDYTMANSYDEKFRLFNIEASVKANILSGMLKVEGSASYLQDEKQTAHEVVGLMHYKCKTVDQTLELNYDRLKDFFNTKELSLSGATHIVSGIKWGANVAIKFSDRINTEDDQQKIGGELLIEFEKIKTFQISASAKVDIDGKDNSKKIKYNVSVRGDIVIGNVPSTYSQVMELISEVSELAKKANNGKGVPIEFKLSPLGPLREHLKHTANQNEFCEKLDDSLLNNFVMTFDDIGYAEQNLNDTYKYLLENEICVSPENRIKISELRGGFMNSKTAFTTSFKDTLIQVRSGNQPESAFADLAKAYKDDEFGAYKIQQKIREFDGAIKKVDFYKVIQKSNNDIKYFGLKGNLDSNLLGNTQDVVYILFTKPEFTKNDPRKYEDCTHLFLTKLEKPFNKRYVVDCDFDYHMASLMSRTVIQQRVNGKIQIEDVNEAIQKTRPFQLLKIRALGRFAQMGQLYNTKEDAFLDENFLKEGYKESSVIKVNSVELEETPVIPSEDILAKFEALGVEPEVRFNILAEMSPLVRTGMYFNIFNKEKQCDLHSKMADRDATRSFVYIKRLKDEEIKVKENDPNFWEALSIQAVNHGATHFVTKIEYGFSFIFSVHNPRAHLLPLKNAQELNNYVNALKKVIARIQIDGAQTQRLKIEELDGLSEHMDVTIYSDLQGQQSKPEILECKEDLLNFLNNKFISKLSKTEKGVPIGYELYPIENLAEMGLLSPFIPYRLLSQEGHDPSEFVKVLDDIDLARVQIKDMHDILKVNKFATDEDTTALEGIKEEFNSNLCNYYKKNIQRVIKEIKAGEDKSEKFRTLLKEFKEQTFFRKNQYIPTDDLKLILKEREENAMKEAGNSKYTSLKEVNILLLSETGAGKTTWINAIANYLKYDTLDDALHAWTVKPTVIIPSKFTMTDGNYEAITVQIGDTASGEIYVEGQSSTQHPTTYTFTTKDLLIRIIDTPGVGDTRGMEVDKINIQHTMSHISNVDVLHGICVLLKPNNSRLSTFFEGCITKILSQLHRDSTPNIAFCFTNTRSTFYLPGESLSVLRTLLKVKNENYSLIPLEKKTIYCLDNEAFRLLAAVQQGQVFEDNFKSDFDESWNVSVLETKRLLANFQMAQPQEVNKMVILHTAREALRQLGNPLASISLNAHSETSEKRRKQFESEVKVIIKTCAGLTAFVHANSMTHFNSSILRCLDSLIEEEGLKVASFGGGATAPTTLDQLKKTRMVYQAKENALLGALKQPMGFRMTGDVRQSIEDLYELLLSGDNIRKLLETPAAGSGNLSYNEKSFTII